MALLWENGGSSSGKIDTISWVDADSYVATRLYLKEPLVGINEAHGGLGPSEFEQPLLISVPCQRVFHGQIHLQRLTVQEFPVVHVGGGIQHHESASNVCGETWFAHHPGDLDIEVGALSEVQVDRFGLVFHRIFFVFGGEENLQLGLGLLFGILGWYENSELWWLPRGSGMLFFTPMAWGWISTVSIPRVLILYGLKENSVSLFIPMVHKIFWGFLHVKGAFYAIGRVLNETKGS